MTPDDKDLIIRQIMTLLWKHQDMPPRLVAERIMIDVIEKQIQEVQDKYEKLFFTDTSKEH